METLNDWFITLTVWPECRINSFELVEKSLKFLNNFEYCLASKELQNNGNWHVHAYIKCIDKSNKNLRRKIKYGVYGYKYKEDIPKPAIKVDKVKTTPGIVNYIMKEVNEENPLLLHSGFQETWIQQQFELGQRKRKKFTSWIYIARPQVPGFLVNYCNINKIIVTNKFDFIELLIRVGNDGYDTCRWRKDIKWIIGQFYSMLNGNDKYMRIYWENELFYPGENIII